MKFNVTRTAVKLTIKQKAISLWMKFVTDLVILLAVSLVFLLLYDQMVEINKWLYLLYLVPLLVLVRFIKTLIMIKKGVTFEFNKETNSLLKNGKKIEELTHIKQVEWNIDSVSDHEESYLELLSSKNRQYRISKTQIYMNKEHLELGKKIAEFLEVEFHNNNPVEKEVIYFGQNKLSQSEMDFIEDNL